MNEPDLTKLKESLRDNLIAAEEENYRSIGPADFVDWEKLTSEQQDELRKTWDSLVGAAITAIAMGIVSLTRATVRTEYKVITSQGKEGTPMTPRKGGVAGAIAEALCERHECPEREQELAKILEDNWDALCGPVVDQADNWLHDHHDIRFADDEESQKESCYSPEDTYL